ncbi:hypothetical protein DOTSEDRAFT_26964 [Dothistroma septosporum NZE10]|uniref:Uncharacterized protein n=1 Tax=Dothistroma septosporum (strain NZE10 / CBS 128990) TaxID=675120 RepID=N1PHK0_DOTSN|nr:hypothetical protein DOTSEDRAFT_26964 [Dothistroma septosporum NZE10]
MTTHESIEAKERRLTDLESQLAATAKAQEDQAAKLSAQQNARESKERELKLRKEAVLSQEKAALVREEKANEASIGRLQSLIDTLNAQVEVLEKEKVQLHRRNDEIDVQLGDGL